jgi:hypothetical protein
VRILRVVIEVETIASGERNMRTHWSYVDGLGQQIAESIPPEVVLAVLEAAKPGLIARIDFDKELAAEELPPRSN